MSFLEKTNAADEGGLRLIISDLQIAAPLGVYRHERRAAQPILVNLELWLGDDLYAEPAIFLPARERPEDEQLYGVVCYEAVCNAVEKLAQERHTDLVETLVGAVADLCLSDGRVRRVRVRIEKTAAVPRTRAVGVELLRKRGG